MTKNMSVPDGPKAERPQSGPSPTKTVDSMVREGDLQATPRKTIEPGLFDLEGKPISVGNTDPNVIGPDDTPEFSYRPDTAYPDVPPQVKRAEHSYILPMAKFISDSIGITVIDDYAYNRVLTALQSNSLFVVLNLYRVKVQDGVASWFGLVLQCRRHPVVLVNFKERLSTEQIGISQIRVWSARDQKYYVYGDDNKFMDREVASATILNYLKQEGILPNI